LPANAETATNEKAAAQQPESSRLPPLTSGGNYPAPRSSPTGYRFCQAYTPAFHSGPKIRRSLLDPVPQGRGPILSLGDRIEPPIRANFVVRVGTIRRFASEVLQPNLLAVESLCSRDASVPQRLPALELVASRISGAKRASNAASFRGFQGVGSKRLLQRVIQRSPMGSCSALPFSNDACASRFSRVARCCGRCLECRLWQARPLQLVGWCW
jgi:hypothetical protein